MFLAQSLSDATGIGENLLGGGIAGALVVALIWALRLLYVQMRSDNKQVDMEHNLVTLAADAFKQTFEFGKSLKENTTALNQLNQTLAGIFSEFTGSLEAVRSELIRNATTRMIIKDKSGQIMAHILVSPEKDENGDTVLVIDYEAMENDN